MGWDHTPWTVTTTRAPVVLKKLSYAIDRNFLMELIHLYYKLSPFYLLSKVDLRGSSVGKT